MPNFDYNYYFKECHHCHRPMLIEVTQFGVSHIADIFVTCRECVTVISDTFKEKQPEAYKDIQEWLTQ